MNDAAKLLDHLRDQGVRFVHNRTNGQVEAVGVDRLSEEDFARLRRRRVAVRAAVRREDQDRRTLDVATDLKALRNSPLGSELARRGGLRRRPRRERENDPAVAFLRGQRKREKQLREIVRARQAFGEMMMEQRRGW